MGQNEPHWKFSRLDWIIQFLECTKDSQEKQQELGITACLAFFVRLSATLFVALPIFCNTCEITRSGRSVQCPRSWIIVLLLAVVTKISLSVSKTDLYKFKAIASLAARSNAQASASSGCKAHRTAIWKKVPLPRLCVEDMRINIPILVWVAFEFCCAQLKH